MIAKLAGRLRPSRDELYRLVVMETDPARAARFEQLAPGPLLAALLLGGALLYGALAAPLRLLRRG